MAFSRPTHITKIKFATKAGKEFEATLGSAFATQFVAANGVASDKFSGKTFLEVDIAGQKHLVAVTLSAKPFKSEKGEALLLHVNQTDTISYVSERQVPIAELKSAAAPAPAPSVPARGTGGTIVRTSAPAAAPATTSRIRTL